MSSIDPKRITFFMLSKNTLPTRYKNGKKIANINNMPCNPMPFTVWKKTMKNSMRNSPKVRTIFIPSEIIK